MKFVRRRVDDYDKVRESDFTETPIRVQRTRRYVGSREGNPVFTVARIFLRPDTSVAPPDRVVFDDVPMQILSYYPAANIDGKIDHVEVEI